MELFAAFASAKPPVLVGALAQLSAPVVVLVAAWTSPFATARSIANHSHLAYPAFLRVRSAQVQRAKARLFFLPVHPSAAAAAASAAVLKIQVLFPACC